jgi:hypothetical protein
MAIHLHLASRLKYLELYIKCSKVSCRDASENQDALTRLDFMSSWELKKLGLRFLENLTFVKYFKK